MNLNSRERHKMVSLEAQPSEKVKIHQHLSSFCKKIDLFKENALKIVNESNLDYSKISGYTLFFI